MRKLAKFYGSDLKGSVEFTHPNRWERQEYPGWSRLVIGAEEDEIPLILDFCRAIEGPFAVLYVLVAPRVTHSGGRYQSPRPLGYKELALFLDTFKDFLEQDGRHHLWVASAVDEGRFIFDNHNVIYAYGDLDRYEAVLRRAGFDPGPVETPDPHGHNYHAEFDDQEAELMTYWDWLWFPLQEADDR